MSEEKPVDFAAWIRSVTVQAGSTGVVLWMLWQQNAQMVHQDSDAWAERKEMLQQMKDAEARSIESRSRQWAEVKAMRENIQAMATEIRELTREIRRKD